MCRSVFARGFWSFPTFSSAFRRATTLNDAAELNPFCYRCGVNHDREIEKFEVEWNRLKAEYVMGSE